MFFLVLFRALRNWKLLLVFGIHLFAIGYCYCYCLRLTCSLLWKGGGLDRWHRSRWRRSRPGTWNDTRTRIDKSRRHHCFSHTQAQAHKQGHVSPFSASTAPRSGALTSIPPPLPPSSQSSKINEAPVSVDNSIRNRFATIQEVYGTIQMSSCPQLFKKSNCTISI